MLAAAPAFGQELTGQAAVSDAGRTITATGAPQQVVRTRINRFVGVETETYDRAGPYLSEGMRKDFERDRRPAAYGVAYMPIAPRAEVFARVGYGGSKSAFSGPRDDSWRYGAGAQYRMNSRDGFRADYTRQGQPRRGVKANIFSIGLVSRF
jgi:outer membrane immunogenic protein